MKASKGKIFLFSIINYTLVNIIFHVIYFLAEYIMGLLSENRVINYLLYYKGFYTSSIILGLILCFSFQSFFLNKAFKKYDDARLVKFISGIFFVIFNTINLISVFFFHANYIPSYATLLIAGIVLLIKNFSALRTNKKSEESISEMFLKNMEQKSNTTTETFPLENNSPSASNIPDTNKTNDLHKSNIIILILSFIAIIAIASNLIVYAYDEGYSSGYTKGRADGSNAAQVESDNTDDYTKSKDTDSTPVSDKPAKSNKKQQNMVWVNGTGKKYHKRSDCSNMNSAYLVTQEEAEDMGKDPCKKCY